MGGATALGIGTLQLNATTEQHLTAPFAPGAKVGSFEVGKYFDALRCCISLEDSLDGTDSGCRTRCWLAGAQGKGSLWRDSFEDVFCKLVYGMQRPKSVWVQGRLVAGSA